MNESIVLSDLCRICNTKQPRYCCPRCRCMTCSLPCYRRHKTWSQCSGKRDPAAYMTRSQLASSAGIDHDYNFLTGIEHSFDRADRNVSERGISLDDFVARPKNAKVRLAQCLEATGAIIHRAPRGMSRQKQNATHVSRFNGQDCVSWTIEWILLDGSRKIKNTEDHNTVRSAWANSTSNKSSGSNKRRKLNTGPPRSEGLVNSSDAGTIQPLHDTEMHKQPHELEPTHPTPKLEDVSEQAQVAENQSLTLGGPDKQSGPYFYLLKPRTVGTDRVLIPLSPSETVRNALKNREVLEFPTIYILRESESNLPPGFQLEDDYIVQERTLVKEIDEELKPFLAVALASQPQDMPENEDSKDSVYNESKVLESLKRDLATATGENES